MIKVTNLTENIRSKCLEALYKDEFINVFLIDYIENNHENIGELFINEEENEIKEILHLKFDGNSYFTNFYLKDEEGLVSIAEQLKNLEYTKILLGGRLEQVKWILTYLNGEGKVTPNIYYNFDIERYSSIILDAETVFRPATDCRRDIEKLKEFYIGFFEVIEEKDIRHITDELKLKEDLDKGVYFIEICGEAIGMARFSGKTKNYIDITTVYISPKYRGRGFGKKLLSSIIETSLKQNKTPVLQTSVENKEAKNLYEVLGFFKAEDYAFEFI